MTIVKETAPAVCESCGKVFQTKYGFFCPECLKKTKERTGKKYRIKQIGQLSLFESTGRNKIKEKWKVIRNDRQRTADRA